MCRPEEVYFALSPARCQESLRRQFGKGLGLRGFGFGPVAGMCKPMQNKVL